MIVEWIRASKELNVRSSVTYITDAHQLWGDLKQHFSVENTLRVHKMKAQLASCRQEGQRVLYYFGWLSVYGNNCRCANLFMYAPLDQQQRLQKKKKHEKIHKFVMGLDDSRFGSICMAIIGTDLLPSLEKYLTK